MGRLGLSILYHREREITKAWDIGVSNRIKADGDVVVPSNLQIGEFTTVDMDNADQRKKSNLSRDEFHGCLITATNHLSRDSVSQNRDAVDIRDVDLSENPGLPDSYSIVPPAELNVNSEAKMKIPNGKVTPDSDRIPGALIKEQAWCESIQSILDAKTVDELDSDDITTWAG